MGRLIPAGTGLAAYKNLNLVVDGEGVVEERYAPSAPPAAAPVPPPSFTAVNEE